MCMCICKLMNIFMNMKRGKVEVDIYVHFRMYVHMDDVDVIISAYIYAPIFINIYMLYVCMIKIM